MTKEQYQKRMEKIRRNNIEKQYRQKIKNEKSKLKQRRGVETSKLLAIYLFALLNAIVIYAMISIWKFADISYLGVLITDIAAQILIYGIYCLKAYKAKKSEEDMKFKREQSSLDDFLQTASEYDEQFQTNVDEIDMCIASDENAFDNTVL